MKQLDYQTTNDRDIGDWCIKIEILRSRWLQVHRKLNQAETTSCHKVECTLVNCYKFLTVTETGREKMSQDETRRHKTREEFSICSADVPSLVNKVNFKHRLNVMEDIICTDNAAKRGDISCETGAGTGTGTETKHRCESWARRPQELKDIVCVGKTCGANFSEQSKNFDSFCSSCCIRFWLCRIFSFIITPHRARWQLFDVVLRVKSTAIALSAANYSKEFLRLDTCPILSRLSVDASWCSDLALPLNHLMVLVAAGHLTRSRE